MKWRLKFETQDLEPIDDYGVYESRWSAMAAFRSAVANPLPDEGSVYVTEDDGYDEVVIATHLFEE